VFDLLVALILVVLVVVVVILQRVAVLPRKTLPFIIAAIGSIVGLSLLDQARSRGLRDQAKRLEEELKGTEKNLADLKARAIVSDQALDQARSDLRSAVEANQKQALLLDKQLKDRHDEIEHMSGDEVAREFGKAYGGTP